MIARIRPALFSETRLLGALALSLALLVLLAPGTAQASCKPNCAAASVVNAAGVPAEVTAHVKTISFKGNALSPQGSKAVAALAAELKTAGLKNPVTIAVPLEDGVPAKDAMQQAEARAVQLRNALVQQGVRPAAVEVVIAR
jgi:hypothetical protein